jgi:hypothetical protein
MKNLRIYMPLVNGEQLTVEFPSGREVIHALMTPDAAAPPRSLVLEAQTADRRTVRLVIPYSEHDPARVLIEGE